MFFILQEVRRIKKEHPDDASAVMNERVKGSLKVTRAFGAGFLKMVESHSQLEPLPIFMIDRLTSLRSICILVEQNHI